MKILFLANRVPYPPYRGDKLKIFNLAKRLCKQHELHLIAFAQNADDWTYKSELEKTFTKVTFIGLAKWQSALNCIGGIFDNSPFQVHYFRSRAMRNAVMKITKQEQFDAIHVQHLRMAQYLAQEQGIPRILDLPDAFSLYWQRKQATTKNILLRFFERLEQKRVFKYEQILRSYQLSLVCSAEDQQYLQEQHQLSNISLLPNGVDTSLFVAGHHDYAHNHTLLFTGNMDYGPNIDAVQYFVSDIFPQILKVFPSVKFIIAGQRPVAKVLALATENIKVTGFIKDLSVQYNTASVVVAPLRFGAGTQNKVLEAMAMGVPVVCSNIGFKGLGITSGAGAIMQTDANLFAQSIIELLSSATMRQQVGEQGAQIIRSKFSWDIIAVQLESYFKQIVCRPKKAIQV
ncbi:MAG: glycosyltransferase [Chitinophagaceae bacterium]|nr:glycosyltransferase [Chitinophagaceae bacterium]